MQCSGSCQTSFLNNRPQQSGPCCGDYPAIRHNWAHVWHKYKQVQVETLTYWPACLETSPTLLLCLWNGRRWGFRYITLRRRLWLHSLGLSGVEHVHRDLSVWFSSRNEILTISTAWECNFQTQITSALFHWEFPNRVVFKWVGGF